jgi:hypothetical protein
MAGFADNSSNNSPTTKFIWEYGSGAEWHERHEGPSLIKFGHAFVPLLGASCFKGSRFCLWVYISLRLLFCSSRP